MLHTIWHDDTVLGTIGLPRGRFVATRLEPAAGYVTVAAIVRRATLAFLQIGLFHDNTLSRFTPMSEAMSDSYKAIHEASQLHLMVVNANGEPVATHFVNLVQSIVDDGIVVLISLDEGASGVQSLILARQPTPTSSIAPAV